MKKETAMEVLALGMSLISLVVSGATYLTTRAQTDLNANVELDFKMTSTGPDATLRLTNFSRFDLQDIVVTTEVAVVQRGVQGEICSAVFSGTSTTGTTNDSSNPLRVHFPALAAKSSVDLLLKPTIEGIQRTRASLGGAFAIGGVLVRAKTRRPADGREYKFSKFVYVMPGDNATMVWDESLVPGIRQAREAPLWASLRKCIGLESDGKD